MKKRTPPPKPPLSGLFAVAGLAVTCIGGYYGFAENNWLLAKVIGAGGFALTGIYNRQRKDFKRGLLDPVSEGLVAGWCMMDLANIVTLAVQQDQQAWWGLLKLAGILAGVLTVIGPEARSRLLKGESWNSVVSKDENHRLHSARFVGWAVADLALQAYLMLSPR